MGSMFTRYKSPALVNLDWTTTFTPELMRKDLDLGLELGREMDVPMPVTARIRSTAVVRNVTPGEGMGVQFMAMSQEHAVRLQTLFTRLLRSSNATPA